MFVIGANVVGGQRARLGEANHFKRIEADIHTARQRKIHFTIGQRVAGRGHTEQRRGTRTVHGESARAKVEMVADAAGDGVGHVARQRILGDFRQRRFINLLHRGEEFLELRLRHPAASQRAPDAAFHIRPAEAQVVAAGKFTGEGIAQHHSHAIAADRIKFQARIANRLARRVKRKPVGHVGDLKGYGRDVELDGIEDPVRNDGHLIAVGFAGRIGVRVEVLRRQAFRRRFAEEAAAGENILPQLLRRMRTRELTGHANNGNRVAREFQFGC